MLQGKVDIETLLYCEFKQYEMSKKELEKTTLFSKHAKSRSLKSRIEWSTVNL